MSEIDRNNGIAKRWRNVADACVGSRFNVIVG